MIFQLKSQNATGKVGYWFDILTKSPKGQKNNFIHIGCGNVPHENICSGPTDSLNDFLKSLGKTKEDLNVVDLLCSETTSDWGLSGRFKPGFKKVNGKCIPICEPGSIFKVETTAKGKQFFPTSRDNSPGANISPFSPSGAWGVWIDINSAGYTSKFKDALEPKCRSCTELFPNDPSVHVQENSNSCVSVDNCLPGRRKSSDGGACANKLCTDGTIASSMDPCKVPKDPKERCEQIAEKLQILKKWNYTQELAGVHSGTCTSQNIILIAKVYFDQELSGLQKILNYCKITPSFQIAFYSNDFTFGEFFRHITWSKDNKLCDWTAGGDPTDEADVSPQLWEVFEQPHFPQTDSDFN